MDLKAVLARIALPESGETALGLLRPVQVAPPPVSAFTARRRDPGLFMPAIIVFLSLPPRRLRQLRRLRSPEKPIETRRRADPRFGRPGKDPRP